MGAGATFCARLRAHANPQPPKADTLVLTDFTDKNPRLGEVKATQRRQQESSLNAEPSPLALASSEALTAAI